MATKKVTEEEKAARAAEREAAAKAPEAEEQGADRSVRLKWTKEAAAQFPGEKMFDAIDEARREVFERTGQPARMCLMGEGPWALWSHHETISNLKRLGKIQDKATVTNLFEIRLCQSLGAYIIVA